MNAFRLFALTLVMILTSFNAAASHGSYLPYGDAGHEYTRSRTSESVTSHESEHESSWNDYGGNRQYHNTDHYDYGRSRDFTFSRTSDYESERHYSNAGSYSSGYASRDSVDYTYPYYDVNAGDYRDYRPYHDYYEMSFTSPYYNPYQYSRVGAYASRYLPYGY